MHELIKYVSLVILMWCYSKPQDLRLNGSCHVDDKYLKAIDHLYVVAINYNDMMCCQPLNGL